MFTFSHNVAILVMFMYTNNLYCMITDKKIILIDLMVVVTFCLLLVAMMPNVSAGQEGTSIQVESTYEVLDKEAKVHVTKDIQFINNDKDTRYWQGYYSYLNYYIPEDAVSIECYDEDKTIGFERAEGNYLTFEFNEKIWYGESYSFCVEYDLKVNKNSAAFNLYEDERSSSVRIIVPSDRETNIRGGDYDVYQQRDQTVYGFSSIESGSGLYFVDCVNHTEMLELKGTVNLHNGPVEIVVKYWEGEDKWAREMLDTAMETLPILEDLWGMPYPVDYNITITESSYNETGGYGGFNNWSSGICMLHTSSYMILIHELAHYWTFSCDFEELWMEEGYADLYAYLVLEQYAPEDGAIRKQHFIDSYEKLEADYDLSLINWSAEEYCGYDNSRRVDFGYKKSFMLAYTLYGEVGLEGMQQANNEFVQVKDIGHQAHINILEDVSGKDLSGIYYRFFDMDI